MDDDLVRALEAKARFREAPKWRKLVSIPVKLAYPAWLSRSRGRSVATLAKTFWGEDLRVVLPELVSVSIYRYGFFERGLSRMLIEYLKPGMTVFDVGAHFGYFTCLSAYLVGPTGQVHAFEPTRSTFEVLKGNAQTRANVRVNNVAAYSRAESIEFSDFGLTLAAFNSLGSGRFDEESRAKLKPSIYKVQAIPLDSYVKETGARPDFIKIDAENAEYDILQGMGQILEEMRPAISVEVGDVGAPQGHSTKVVECLVGKGYRPYEWRDEAIRPHEPLSSYEYNELLFLPQPP